MRRIVENAWVDAVNTILTENPNNFNRYMLIMNYMRKRFGDPIGCGSYRAVFDTKDGFIAKVPLDANGERDNRIEADVYNRHPASHYAKCKIQTIDGLDVLIMEKLHDLIRKSSFREPQLFDQESDDPYWITKLDAGQVGLDSHNQVKAYDYSRNAHGNFVEDKQMSRAAYLLLDLDERRAGGEHRGSSYDRHARKEWMIKNQGNGKTAKCVHCGKELDINHLEADRIKCGGSYRHDNIQPACRDCNLARSNHPDWKYTGAKH